MTWSPRPLARVGALLGLPLGLLLGLLLGIPQGNALSCADLRAVPCLEVPKCDGLHLGTATLAHLVSGGPARSLTAAELCYTSEHLRFSVGSTDQTIFPPKLGGQLAPDRVELFIGSGGVSDPTCYSQLTADVHGALQGAGIHNRDRSGATVERSEWTGDWGQGMASVSASAMAGAWRWDGAVAWGLINHPAGCPWMRRSGSARGAPGMVYRANLFRMNELSACAACSPTTCEFVAWSPTLTNPPSLHEPASFGYLLLV